MGFFYEVFSRLTIASAASEAIAGNPHSEPLSEMEMKSEPLGIKSLFILDSNTHKKENIHSTC